MTRLLRFSLLSALLIHLSVSSFAQKGFEGTIVYSIDVNGEGLPPEAKQMFAGSEMIMSLKGTLARTDLNMGVQKTIGISDAKAKTSYTLMDIMGQKFKIVTKTGDKQPTVTVKELTETKEIAGYTCKKAELTIEGQTDPVVVYYTDQILNNGYNSQIKGIKGYPLEFEAAQSGMKISYAAKSVTKEAVDDSKFTPDNTGYTETTREDMMKNFGGK